ncbi:unnamed protein product [Caenorhabditis sp. 36 PRJEB53466]|nr:unnamed protein product [Caenorhabditis sp. 36 PRJEB53466]
MPGLLNIPTSEFRKTFLQRISGQQNVDSTEPNSWKAMFDNPTMEEPCLRLIDDENIVLKKKLNTQEVIFRNANSDLVKRNLELESHIDVMLLKYKTVKKRLETAKKNNRVLERKVRRLSENIQNRNEDEEELEAELERLDDEHQLVRKALCEMQRPVATDGPSELLKSAEFALQSVHEMWKNRCEALNITILANEALRKDNERLNAELEELRVNMETIDDENLILRETVERTKNKETTNGIPEEYQDLIDSLCNF